MYYLTEERQLMVNIAKEFAEKEVRPVALEHDKQEKFPLELLRRAGELGLLGIPYAEEKGGIGSDWTTYALVLTEIGKVMPVLAAVMSTQSVVCVGLLDHIGNPEQIKKYMVPAIKGEVVCSGAFTESTGGSNPFEMQGNAVQDGDEWIINSNKVFITNSGEYADVYLVMVRTGELNLATFSGFTFFIVEKGTPGLTVAPSEHKLGLHGSATGSVTFKNVRVPKENVMGQIGNGLLHLRATTSDEFMWIGALCLGLAEEAYNRALKYSMERMQMGKSMYDSYQVTRHKLALMNTEITTLRDLVFTSYYLRDQGVDVLDRAYMLKLKGARIAEYVAGEAIQLHGGVGVVRDSGIERLWRDAKVAGIAGGSLEDLTERLTVFMRKEYYNIG